MRRAALLWAMVLLGVAGLAPAARAQEAAPGRHFPADDDLRLLLRYMVEDEETPGVALALVEPDGATRVVVYGSAGGTAVEPGTAFELGELTMPFTATLLAEMVARGEVSLDDPVAAYLPADVTVPSLSGFEITLGHLAEHRSGLPAEPPAAYAEFTVDDLYAFLGRYELDWVPGRRRENSVLGYGLLGHALARAAGVPFAELLRVRVLEPLGMAGTGYAPSAVAQGFLDGDPVPATEVTEALQGGTGLRSTPRDMAAFLALNTQPPDTPLGRAARVARKVRTPDLEGEGYGFSWRASVTGRQQLLMVHGGRTNGFTALTALDPAKEIGTALLANTGDFRDWAARALLYFTVPEHVDPVPVDPGILEQYAGAYGGRGGRYRASLNRGSTFIRSEGDHLTWQPNDNIRTPLFATSDSTFYMLRAPFTVTFERVGDDMQLTAVVDERDPDAVGRTYTRWRVSTELPSPAVVAGNAPPWSTWAPGTWFLVVGVGAVAVLLILRPVWSGRRAR